MKTKIAGLARDERGSVLIEAAIIFPILVMILLGMIEFGNAFTAKRRVQNVASTAADLVAQYQVVATSNLNDIASVGIQLMLPFSRTGLSLTITSVAQDSSNNITVQWSCSWASSSSTVSCSTAQVAYKGLPAGLLTANQSLIIGQASYLYNATMTYFLAPSLTLSATSYFRPRLVPSIPLQQ